MRHYRANDIISGICFLKLKNPFFLHNSSKTHLVGVSINEAPPRLHHAGCLENQLITNRRIHNVKTLLASGYGTETSRVNILRIGMIFTKC